MSTILDKEIMNFIKVLRHLGLKVGTAEILEAVKSIDYVGMLDKRRLSIALGGLLAKDKASQELFKRAFDIYFVSPQERKNHLLEKMAQEQEEKETINTAQLELSGQNIGMELNLSEDELHTYTRLTDADKEAIKEFLKNRTKGNNVISPDKLLETIVKQQLRYWKRKLNADVEDTQSTVNYQGIGDEQLDALLDQISKNHVQDEDIMYKDFQSITEHELAKFNYILDRLAHQWATQISRRYQQTKKRQLLDFRKSLRLNIGTGGALFNLKYKSKKITKPKLMIICDVSGSMAKYAAFILQFIYGLAFVVSDIHSYVFAEDIEEVTHYFNKAKTFEQIMAELMNSSSNWGEGTNLGRSLDNLGKFGYGLDKDSILILLSDGKTIGIDRSTKSLVSLSNRVKRFIWLNPEKKTGWSGIPLVVNTYKQLTIYECNCLAHLNSILSKERKLFI